MALRDGFQIVLFPYVVLSGIDLSGGGPFPASLILLFLGITAVCLIIALVTRNTQMTTEAEWASLFFLVFAIVMVIRNIVISAS